MAKSRVSERDLRLTEALIGQSFDRVKTSVARAPGDLVRPATNLVREHPLATAAAAAGTGMVVFRILRLLTPRVVVKEVVTDTTGEVIETKKGQDLTSQVISIAMPYVVGYLQQELGKMMAGREQSR